jgi:hypothetical protein
MLQLRSKTELSYLEEARASEPRILTTINGSPNSELCRRDDVCGFDTQPRSRDLSCGFSQSRAQLSSLLMARSLRDGAVVAQPTAVLHHRGAIRLIATTIALFVFVGRK